MKASSWDLRASGPLTEAALRLKYLPAWHHRIAVYRYEAGAKFRGTARAGDLYVLEGRCRLEWAADECVLAKNEFVTHPRGDYSFEALGDQACTVAHVWLLPPELRVMPPSGETS